MSKNRKIFLIILLLSFVFHLWGQNHNPFEIRTGKGGDSVAGLKSAPATKSDTILLNNNEKKLLSNPQNPFEINGVKKDKDIRQAKQSVAKKETELTGAGEKKYHGDESFLLWLFLFLLVFMAILLTINRYLIAKIIKATWYHNLTNILYRTFFNRDLILYLSLAIVFVLNLSIFIYLLARHFFGFTGFSFYLYILAGVVLIYAFKHFFIYLFVKIFPGLKNLIVYNFTVLLFSITIGILLLPINLIIAYSYQSVSLILMYFTIAMLIFFYVFRLFRGFLATYTYINDSIFHFFLYLCAFEILPLLAIYRFVTGIID